PRPACAGPSAPHRGAGPGPAPPRPRHWAPRPPRGCPRWPPAASGTPPGPGPGRRRAARVSSGVTGKGERCADLEAALAARARGHLAAARRRPLGHPCQPVALLAWGDDPPGTPRWPGGPCDYAPGALARPARGAGTVRCPAGRGVRPVAAVVDDGDSQRRRLVAQ